MAVQRLTIAESRRMFVCVAERVVGSKDLLTEADMAIGDGDHGIGMARGFEAVAGKLGQQQRFDSVGSLLRTIGMTLVSSVGGAAGPVFGTMFIGGARRLGESQSLDSKALALMLEDALSAVQGRGRALVGDKTMVDALAPAADAAALRADASLLEALRAAAEAARQGMESTKTMVAKIGKAKTLGDRSLGHPDPGAVSTALILTFMGDFVEQL
jgi:dihydroxyacetone kinase-like protein